MIQWVLKNHCKEKASIFKIRSESFWRSKLPLYNDRSKLVPFFPHHFVERWTIKIQEIRTFHYLNSNKIMKKKRMIQWVLKNHCKEKTSIFKIHSKKKQNSNLPNIVVSASRQKPRLHVSTHVSSTTNNLSYKSYSRSCNFRARSARNKIFGTEDRVLCKFSIVLPRGGKMHSSEA